jgi:hypothetical protein
MTWFRRKGARILQRDKYFMESLRTIKFIFFGDKAKRALQQSGAFSGFMKFQRISLLVN